jgi:hypothetical protein
VKVRPPSPRLSQCRVFKCMGASLSPNMLVFATPHKMPDDG